MLLQYNKLIKYTLTHLKCYLNYLILLHTYVFCDNTNSWQDNIWITIKTPHLPLNCPDSNQGLTLLIQWFEANIVLGKNGLKKCQGSLKSFIDSIEIKALLYVSYVSIIRSNQLPQSEKCRKIMKNDSSSTKQLFREGRSAPQLSLLECIMCWSPKRRGSSKPAVPPDD